MQYTTLKEAVQKIKKLEKFQGNSISGQKFLYKGRQFYIVHSYATPIFGICLSTDEVIINLTKYSVTSSRHQGTVQNALNEMENYGFAREIYDLPRCDMYGFLGRFA